MQIMHIDGPTQSTGYNIKQIGANAIADNSITSTKPAESFMKRVTVNDNGPGHAVGWDPDGVTNNFLITEPSVGSADGTFVSVRLDFDLGCEATSASSGQFFMICELSPSEGDVLYYLVENLPPHVVS